VIPYIKKDMQYKCTGNQHYEIMQECTNTHIHTIENKKEK